MDTFHYSEARANLKSIMDKVCSEHAPVIISRQSGLPVVMMSLEEFQELDETAYLLRSPANAAKLAQAVSDVEREIYQRQSLIEE